MIRKEKNKTSENSVISNEVTMQPEKKKLSNAEYDRMVPKILAAVKEDVQRITIKEFAANTSKETLETFINFPDHHVINFTMSSIITVKALKEMAARGE